MDKERGHQHHHRHAWHPLQQTKHGPAHIVAIVDIGEGQAELMSHRSFVFLGHQAQGFVEGVSGAQSAAHRVQRIRQAFLERSETLATVARDFQYG
ncbi:hypothetical protein D3C84_1065260 [compost metagenome]